MMRSPPGAIVSLENGGYDGKRRLNSPRSVEACHRLGIDPSELLVKPHGPFFAGVSRSVGEMRVEHFETQRIELIQLATAERANVSSSLDADAAATTPPTSPSISYRSLGSTPRTSRTCALRSPDATSAARIRLIRDQDERHRAKLQHKTQTSLVAAEERRRHHLDAASHSSDVVQRVAAARHRWMSSEQALNQRHSHQASEKLFRIEAQRESLKEKAHIHLIQATETKEMKLAEARDRSLQMQISRRLRLEQTMHDDEEKCAAAVQRVEAKRAQEAAQRRLKFEETTIHAAELKAMMDEKRQMDAIAQEAALESKIQTVEQRHREIQENQHRKFTIRRHYFERGEKIQQDIRGHQQKLAQQRELERMDRLRANAVEREMIIEAKRDDEEDRRMKCLRARRALDYAEGKRKLILATSKDASLLCVSPPRL
jgi:hypothetical protein